ncbi:PREDICTED: pro-cathepsin H-like [Amphimedon queenslandica]|uniref:Peptidase C1A papain C-terminal domain-containing protein n=1 Tax=Amphimedon queenslandica TaxID=400682 RepID=A0AAN0IT53_AMPQE|nr:PREDICTED: pro-cathepsin H-like [Amphimedon queenslandica]|eukprot:XP_011409353.1 PREDICTED: pro-cathepsin H-like [Amphimedon queenslandica]
MKRKGVCPESNWPYITRHFHEEPSDSCYVAAEGNWVCEYESLDQDRDQLRACLIDECPFVFAFKVCDSFMDMDRRNECIMQMPNEEEQGTGSCVNHTVVAVGYNDGCRCFKVLNSWGSDWGDKGYFYMPYEFIEDPSLCYDFWKISFACQRGAPHPDKNSSRRSNQGASGFVSINIRWDTQRQAVDLYTDNKNY